MSFHSRFPFLKGLIDHSTAKRLERRFNEACTEADIETGTPEAEAIAIGLIADYASGWAASPSALTDARNSDQTPN